MDEIKLSERQKSLLEAIIREFMDTAEAVGSIHLPVKYDLHVSPATVRNEMMSLVKKGFLKKPHASSGRIPTPLAFKYFIDEILNDYDQMEYDLMAKLKEEIFRNRYSMDQLMFDVVRTLFEYTGNTGVAILNNRVYYKGISSLMEMPEYQHSRRIWKLVSVLENYESLLSIFGRVNDDLDNSVKVLIGKEDIGYDELDNEAMVFAPVYLHSGQKGYVAVIGPSRMDYAKVIPTVKWIASSINQSMEGWT
jgi:transcriptional regulator of heat shock response